ERDQHLLALLVVEAVERLAVGLAAVRVGGRDPLAVELRRRERQLVALLWRGLLPRALHVEPVALSPGGGARAVDIDVDAEIGALGRELVGRHHVVDQRLDEGGLLEVEERVALGGRCGSRLLRLRALRQRDGGGRGGGGRAADHGALQEVAPRQALVTHAILPASGFCVPDYMAAKLRFSGASGKAFERMHPAAGGARINGEGPPFSLPTPS